MKKFILNFLICISPSLIIFLTLEVVAESIPNSYRYKREWIERNGKGVSTIILGNSHTFDGIQPLLMDSAFNLSNSAQGLEYDRYLLKFAYEKCTNLKTVILSLDYMNLFMVSPEDAEDHRLVYYTIYLGYDKHSRLSKYGYELFTKDIMIDKIKTYVNSKLNGKIYETCDTLGSSTANHISLFEEGNLGSKYMDMMMPLWHDVNDYIAINYCVAKLEEIAAFCQEKQLRLILVNLPFYHILNEQAHTSRLTSLDSVANMLKHKYNIEYYDYRTDKNYSHTDSLFINCDHLSDIGAKKFTLEIINPILKK